MVLKAFSFLYSTSSPTAYWLFGNSCAIGIRGGSLWAFGAAPFFFFGFLFFFFLAADSVSYIDWGEWSWQPPVAPLSAASASSSLSSSDSSCSDVPFFAPVFVTAVVLPAVVDPFTRRSQISANSFRSDQPHSSASQACPQSELPCWAALLWVYCILSKDWFCARKDMQRNVTKRHSDPSS